MAPAHSHQQCRTYPQPYESAKCGRDACASAGVAGSSLKVLFDDPESSSPSTTAIPSVAMPGAVTDLGALLAGDPIVCLGPPRRSSSQEPAATPSLESAATEPEMDPRLVRVIEMWPSLPSDLHTAIMDAIDAATSMD